MRYNEYIEVTANEEELDKLRKSSIPVEKVLCLKNRLFTSGGVYIVFRNGCPAYVGKTTQPLRTRLRGHMSKSVYPSLLGEFLNKSLEPFTISIVDDGAAKRIMNGYTGDVEFFLINTLQPEFNRHFLLPGKLTGEAKRRQLGLQREREKRYDFRKKSDKFYWRVVSDFHHVFSMAELPARSYVNKAANDFASGKQVDIEEVKREARKLLIAELEGLKRKLESQL